MLRVKLESGKHIDLDYYDIKGIIEDNIESIVDTHLSECKCALNENTSQCECDGGGW